MQGYSAGAVTLLPDGAQSLQDAELTQIDGRTTLAFTKLLAEDGEPVVSINGTNLVYAFGSANTFSYHATRGGISLSFGSSSGTLPMPAPEPEPELEPEIELEPVIPETEPEPEPEPASAVQIEIVLEIALESIAEGSSARASFENDIVAEIAAALEIPQSRVRLVSIRSGSVVVTFEILPSYSSNDPSASALAETFANLVEDSNSVIYTSGSVLPNIDPDAFDALPDTDTGTEATTPPSSCGGAEASDTEGYDCMVSLLSPSLGHQIHWRALEPGDAAVSIRVVYSGTGWVALGFRRPTEPAIQMPGTFAVIGKPDEAPESQVRKYTIAVRTTPSSIFAMSVTHSTQNGVATLSYLYDVC